MKKAVFGTMFLVVVTLLASSQVLFAGSKTLKIAMVQMLEQNLQQLVEKSIVVDAVYLPLDSFMVSNAKLIGDKLREAKVKSIGALEGYIKGGVLIGVVPDYYQLGKSLASIVDKSQKGEKLQNIPVVTVKEPRLMINKMTADLLQITIPEAVLKKAVLVE